jgi:hypothetical protein
MLLHDTVIGTTYQVSIPKELKISAAIEPELLGCVYRVRAKQSR